MNLSQVLEFSVTEVILNKNIGKVNPIIELKFVAGFSILSIEYSYWYFC